MNIDEIRHEIASEERFITKQQAKMDRMRSLEAGVRAGTVSTDLAMFQISIDNAKARIAVMQKQMENMKHG
jgi:predicted  nucleic acid-binding Zn-ribbon protein